MIKLAILGIENSHSWHFSSILAPKGGKKKYPDVELLGVYGDENVPGVEEGIEKIKEMSTCVAFAKRSDDFVQEADAVMVTAANGADHFRYAKPYIEKGIPVWIDKPTTRDPKELVAMWELAEKHGAILCGGSGLQYAEEIEELAEFVRNAELPIAGGHVTAPIGVEDNPFGGFWFYTPHLVQMMTTVFGPYAKSVQAMRTAYGVQAIYHYDGFDVTAFFGAGYSVTVYPHAWGAVSKSFDLSPTYYAPPLEHFYQVLKSGKTDKTKQEFMAPVFIIDATIRSYTDGREIAINLPQE